MRNQDYTKTIKALFASSNILIVAVDTPHLIEENGLFCDARNYVSAVNNLIKNNVKFEENGKSTGKKMVLFVPLKCEKYKHDGRMDEVNSKIKEVYKETFDYLGGENANNCVLAITPIFTMGGIEFSQFEREGRNIKIKEEYGKKVPEKAFYRHWNDEKEPKFEFCEQPLLYILVFMLENARQKKENSNIFAKIFDLFRNMPSAKDFLERKESLKEKIKRDGDGYQIVQNPMGI